MVWRSSLFRCVAMRRSRDEFAAHPSWHSRSTGSSFSSSRTLQYEAGGDKKDLPVLNYRKAMRRAEELIRELPLCQRVVCEAHKVLMSGVRGHNKAPGEYRRIPNWIGPPGSKLEDATYVPI